jgi:hypothetical protein
MAEKHLPSLIAPYGHIDSTQRDQPSRSATGTSTGIAVCVGIVDDPRVRSIGHRFHACILTSYYKFPISRVVLLVFERFSVIWKTYQLCL